MRAAAIGLVACGLLVTGAAPAAATEWVVLRVERVEVAVAHADGTPWDAGPVESVKCRIDGGESIPPTEWGAVARRLCVDPASGADPAGPDLFVRLVVGSDRWYVTPVAPDRTVHSFAVDFLVPLDVIPADGLNLEVSDQDGIAVGAAEVLGAVKVTRKDIRDLLASPSRVKTRSNGSVTRFELSARRYRLRRGHVARLTDAKRVALIPREFIAGEVVEIKVKGRDDVMAVIGGRLTSFNVGRCSRGIVRSGGRMALAVDQPGEPATVSISVARPALKLWRSAIARYDCDRLTSGRPSGAAISALSVSANVAQPSALDMRAVLDERYLQGIKRCHERALRTDALAVGDLHVVFRVSEAGVASMISVHGFDSAVDTCVESLVGKWKLPAPKDSAGDPTSADVYLDLALN